MVMLLAELFANCYLLIAFSRLCVSVYVMGSSATNLREWTRIRFSSFRIRVFWREFAADERKLEQGAGSPLAGSIRPGKEYPTVLRQVVRR